MAVAERPVSRNSLPKSCPAFEGIEPRNFHRISSFPMIRVDIYVNFSISPWTYPRAFSVFFTVQPPATCCAATFRESEWFRPSCVGVCVCVSEQSSILSASRFECLRLLLTLLRLISCLSFGGVSYILVTLSSLWCVCILALVWIQVRFIAHILLRFCSDLVSCLQNCT